jgi:hypothetical protein
VGTLIAVVGRRGFILLRTFRNQRPSGSPLTVESSPGQGATFTIVLPVKQGGE